MSQIKDVMLKEVNTIDESATAIDAVKVMGTSGYVIILKQGMPIGIITERDIIIKVLVTDEDIGRIAVTDIMSAPLITIDPDEELTAASQLMKTHNVGKLVVMRGNILYGVITDMTISRHFYNIVNRTTRELIRWTAFL